MEMVHDNTVGVILQQQAIGSGACPVSKVMGGAFQYYLVVKFHNSFATVREMKHTSQSQHCC